MVLVLAAVMGWGEVCETLGEVGKGRVGGAQEMVGVSSLRVGRFWVVAEGGRRPVGVAVTGRLPMRRGDGTSSERCGIQL
jgi:hypothetical protein